MIATALGGQTIDVGGLDLVQLAWRLRRQVDDCRGIRLARPQLHRTAVTRTLPSMADTAVLAAAPGVRRSMIAPATRIISSLELVGLRQSCFT
jgi:hypothetical protein